MIEVLGMIWAIGVPIYWIHAINEAHAVRQPLVPAMFECAPLALIWPLMLTDRNPRRW